ncbi:MAG: hypothetical protein JSV86_11595 [Gemmatimonadota bacterium]|nr:MAG: hypothetical protein JSV86_11595 [Gemmatimonadota bacterium]
MHASASATGLLLIAALGVGCASGTKAPSASETAQPTEYDISDYTKVKIYWSGVPACDFLEVGTVRAEYRPGSTGIRNLQRAVWTARGNAAIGVRTLSDASGRRVVAWEAIAIRITDPACLR